MITPRNDTRLKGVHVMLLEDDALIFINHEEMLTNMGCHVSGAMTIEGAIKELQNGTPDVAVLDLNIRGQKSYGVANVLRNRSVPIIFITGYQPDSFEHDWRPHLNVCEKPCNFDELQYLLLKVLNKLGASDREITLRPPRGFSNY